MLKIATAAAAIGLLAIAVTSSARADVGGNASTINGVRQNSLTKNALTGNALTGNALTGNALTGNALTGNALTGNGLSENTLANNIVSMKTLAAGASGTDGRLLVIELPAAR